MHFIALQYSVLCTCRYISPTQCFVQYVLLHCTSHTTLTATAGMSSLMPFSKPFIGHPFHAGLPGRNALTANIHSEHYHCQTTYHVVVNQTFDIILFVLGGPDESIHRCIVKMTSSHYREHTVKGDLDVRTKIMVHSTCITKGFELVWAS